MNAIRRLTITTMCDLDREKKYSDFKNRFITDQDPLSPNVIRWYAQKMHGLMASLAWVESQSWGWTYIMQPTYKHTNVFACNIQ